MKPTRPNKTGRSTKEDVVQTPTRSAQLIVDHFNPKGSVLDPCAGAGAFFNAFPSSCDRFKCEVMEGSDFFDWEKPVDWIITNPPYSIYDLFLYHAFEVANNVVFFAPIAKGFKSNKVYNMVKEYGGLCELVYMGGGNKHGFRVGFPVGCLHYKKNYVGDCLMSEIIETNLSFDFRKEKKSE